MFCKNCGAEISDGIEICSKCGMKIEDDENEIKNKNLTKSEMFNIKDIFDKILKLKNKLMIPIVVGIILFVILILGKVFVGQKGDVKGDMEVDISMVLKEVKVSSELSTLIVPYNSVYKAEEPKKKSTDKTKYKYYVAYEGTITMGLDIKEIKIIENKKNKTIDITMPEIKINTTEVDPNSVDIIYVKNKYNKEGSLIEIRKECDEDLRQKVKNNAHIYDLALENAKSTIENLIKPMIDMVDSSYTINFN